MKNMNFISETVQLDKIPNAKDILAEDELIKYNSFKFDKRRMDWLGGRYAAKTAVIKALNLGSIKFSDVVIENEPSGKPYFRVNGKVYPNVLSISHCRQYAAASVSLKADMLLGIDIEVIEKRPDSWVKEAFSPKENVSADALEQTRLWSQKEAVLKALSVGLSVDLYHIGIVDNAPVFYNKLLKIWQDMGEREIKILSYQKPNGFITSIAFNP